MEHIIDTDPRVERVVERLERIRSLPTLPSVAMEVMALARDPGSNMQQIEEVILTDPALATKILKVANSPFYGMRREISSLRLALTALGMTQIRSLVLGVSVLKAMETDAGNGFDYEALWEHSTGTAVLCKLLAGRFGLDFRGEEYVAGLVHDIGKVILDQYLHEEFSQALAEARRKHEPLEAAERAVIGVDHAFAGAWLARKWRLPESLVEAIGGHHSPATEPGALSMAAVVNLADGIARISRIGDSVNPQLPEFQALEGWRIMRHAVRDTGGKVTASMTGDTGDPQPNQFLEEMTSDIESARNFAQVL